VLIAAKPYEGELLRRAIEGAGYLVRIVDAGSACEVVRRERPAAVVLAVRRGQEEDCAKTVEELARLGATPVLLVSDAGTGITTPEQAQALGACGLLLRPVDPIRLAESLGGALRSRPVPAPEEPASAARSRPARPTGPQLPAVTGRMLTGPQLPIARPTGPILAVETLRMLLDDHDGIGDPPRTDEVPVPSRSAVEGGAPASEARNSVADPASEAPATRFAARSGSLGGVDLPHLLEQALRSELTGRLMVQRDDAVKTVIFDGGAPVFATSNQPYDRLGDLLYREGKLSWEQYIQSQDLMIESGRRIGAVLVDKGLIKPRELFPLVRRQVEEIIYSIFSWWDGHFVIGFGEPSPEERIRLEVHPTALIVEGIRRKYSVDRLLELVGPAETQLLALPAVEQRLARAGLSANERAALQAMDGERTLREIAQLVPIDEHQLYQVVYASVVLGVVLPRGAGDIRAYGGEPVPVAQRRDLAIDRQRVAAKHSQVQEGDYFALLGLRRDATSHEVLRAYQRMRLDFGRTAIAEEVLSELSAEVAEIRELVEEAYQILGDDALREAYRESLES
jgi:ActR/RegA family two-component response regulator